MTPTGGVPDDNPFAGSLVYSYGHRNPQGLAWDDDDQLWAAEFGQDTWDELNRIVPGGNYGWPEVEGIGEGIGEDADVDFINPELVWRTTDASPSGLLYTQGTFFMASLRGERIWILNPEEGTLVPVDWFVEEYGRIRDVVAGPDSTLWFITSNTDGRGDPGDGDDHLWEVRLQKG